MHLPQHNNACRNIITRLPQHNNMSAITRVTRSGGLSCPGGQPFSLCWHSELTMGHAHSHSKGVTGAGRSCWVENLHKWNECILDFLLYGHLYYIQIIVDSLYILQGQVFLRLLQDVAVAVWKVLFSRTELWNSELEAQRVNPRIGAVCKLMCKFPPENDEAIWGKFHVSLAGFEPTVY